MAPDRVPPPNTRALAPGQAQPYYQGDPIPATQRAANRPATAIAALPAEADSRTASGRTLSWAQPGAAVASPAAPTFAPPAPVMQQQPQPIVAANEGSVAVPNDGDPLRFALPAPQVPEKPAPIASAPPVPAQPQALQPVAVQPGATRTAAATISPK